MSSPLVTVIIPLHDKEAYIESTLSSVARQTYRNIEIVIIDDSSADESLAIASTFLKMNESRFAKVTVVSRANTGQAGARNDGIALAQGELIAFLDADDLWHPDKIAKQVRFLNDNPQVDLVLCNYFMFFANRNFVKRINLLPIKKKIKLWLLTVGYGGL